MYLSERVPLPWRVLMTWERLCLGRTAWSDGTPAVTVRDGVEKARLLALGDLALIPAHASNGLGNLDGLSGILSDADIRIGNLEAVVSSRLEAAVELAIPMRAEPGVSDMLRVAGFDVVNSANNHALDYGSQGLADCVGLLRARGIDVCGVEMDDGRQPCVIRIVNSIRVGFLGFCDDINTATATGAPRPCLWSPERAAAAVAAARREVDIVIVQMHWGYEFSLHPLLRHRDQARHAVDRGAHAVICHHAHVPQGFEVWKGCPIVYGLGNAFMPMFSYMLDGHPWADRSYALELGIGGDGVVSMRLHPLRLQPDGSPVLLEGRDKTALLAGLARMSARLGDDDFLERCERARLVFEAVRLVSVLQEAAAQGGETLEERVALLELPRQQSLIGFLGQQSRTTRLAGALRSIVAARRAGNLPAIVADLAPGFTSALEDLRDLYRWSDALRARVP